MDKNATTEQNESGSGATDRGARNPGVPPSGHRNLVVPSQQHDQSITGSNESSWRNMVVPSSEYRQSGPGASSTQNIILPESEHCQWIPAPNESGPWKLMFPLLGRHQSRPSVIDRSPQNVKVPASDRSRLITGPEESSPWKPMIPSSEQRQSGPGVVDHSPRNMIVPESEYRQLIRDSEQGSSRKLMVPSSERQQSGPGVIDHSPRNVIAPESEYRHLVRDSDQSSSRKLMIPSSERHQSGPGVMDHSPRKVIVPESEYRQLISSKEVSSRKPMAPSSKPRESVPGALGRSMLKLIKPGSERSQPIKQGSPWKLMVPSSEHRPSVPGSIGRSMLRLIVPGSGQSQSARGTEESSQWKPMIPSSERQQTGPGVIDHSPHNVIVPESEYRQLIRDSEQRSSQKPMIPSLERRQSGPSVMESNARKVVVPGPRHHKSLTDAIKSSARNLAAPWLESQQPVRSGTDSGKKHLVPPSPDTWPSFLDGTRGLEVISPEARKSMTLSSSTNPLPVSATTTTKTGSSRRKSADKEMLAKVATKAKAQRKSWLTRPLLMITVVTSLGSSFQLGYNLWVVNHPSTLIEDFYNTTYHIKNNVGIDKSFLSVLFSLTIGIFSIGGIIGSLLFSPLVDRFGRKGVLMLNNFLSMGSSILMGLSATIRAYEYTIFSRMVNGICSGIFACAVPLYLVEVAPKNLRAGIMTVSMVFVAIGVMISQILALPEVLGNKQDWPILLSIPGGLALFQVIILPFFPESPRYLLIQKRREESARQALQTLRCQDNVDQEIEELYQEDQAEKAEKVMTGMKLLCYRGLRWQVVTAIVLVSGQELSGFNAAYLLSERIYMTMSLSPADIRYIGVISTMSLLMPLIIVMYIIDTVGRRILILFGFGICSILCVLLTMTLELQNTMTWMSYISSSLIFLFFMGHIIGPGAVPLVLVAEMFLQSSRSTAFGLSGFVHWLMSFVSGLIFRQVESQIGSYSFLIYWPLCFGTFFYIFKFIPETRGKSFLEIRKLMSLHMTTARKIQVQGRGSVSKQGKQGKRERPQTGKKKKRRKSVV